jgi:hypothetical protein
VRISPPIEVLRSRVSKIWTSRPAERLWGSIVVRVSSYEEGGSAECGRASAECGRVSARCCRVSLGSSSMTSFCRRVSNCEELESDKLEGAEASDIVRISTACSVLGMAGALKGGKCFQRKNVWVLRVRCGAQRAQASWLSRG